MYYSKDSGDYTYLAHNKITYTFTSPKGTFAVTEETFDIGTISAQGTLKKVKIGGKEVECYELSDTRREAEQLFALFFGEAAKAPNDFPTSYQESEQVSICVGKGLKVKVDGGKDWVDFDPKTELKPGNPTETLPYITTTLTLTGQKPVVTDDTVGMGTAAVTIVDDKLPDDAKNGLEFKYDIKGMASANADGTLITFTGNFSGTKWDWGDFGKVGGSDKMDIGPASGLTVTDTN
jgi:hypothetical protein